MHLQWKKGYCRQNLWGERVEIRLCLHPPTPANLWVTGWTKSCNSKEFTRSHRDREIIQIPEVAHVLQEFLLLLVRLNSYFKKNKKIKII